jgi:hypothetical protein
VVVSLRFGACLGAALTDTGQGTECEVRIAANGRYHFWAVIYRTREYFAVRGQAAFVLGMGSAAWEEHRPLIEQIAARFELAE